MTAFIPWPTAPDVIIRNARVPGCLLDGGGAELVDCSIRVADGVITEIDPPHAAGSEIDLGHGIVMPGLSDLHTHLDKGHIWPRASNPDGTHAAAVATVKSDREANWSAPDVAARMEFGLRCAYAHGTVAIRTHLDSAGDQLDISWPVFQQKRAEWAGRIALQAVALVPLDLYATPFVERMANVVADAGGIMGGTGAVQPDAPALVHRLFDLATDRNLDIDLHVDETGDRAAHLLRLVADETIRRNWHGRVTCGHCCSLSVHDEADAAETIARVAAASITIVSLPMVNLYLQGRNGGTPVWRGVTLLHELRAAGVRVALASDNTRDPFYAFGDLDLVEVLREGVRIGHLDAPVGAWPAAVAALPADVMGAATGRIRAGAAADLTLFSARSWSEFFARPQADRLVIRNGNAIDATPPSYRELDAPFDQAR